MLAERDLETQNDAGDQNRQSGTAHLPHYLRHWLTNCLIGFIFMQENQTHNLRLIQACTKHLPALYSTQLASFIYLTFIQPGWSHSDWGSRFQDRHGERSSDVGT